MRSPDHMYTILAESLNEVAAATFGEKKKQDTEYEKTKDKRMELLTRRRELRLRMKGTHGDEDEMETIKLKTDKAHQQHIKTQWEHTIR